MKRIDLISDLYLELEDLGYVHKIVFEGNRLIFPPKKLFLNPADLFFIDEGFVIENQVILFLINAPLYNVKGVLEITKGELEGLKLNGYEDKLALDLIPYHENSPAIKIARQYGMRKITRVDFDSNRFEIRQNRPDFPPCPYGHSFEVLGYDLHTKQYVRLATSILKEWRKKGQVD